MGVFLTMNMVMRSEEFFCAQYVSPRIEGTPGLSIGLLPSAPRKLAIQRPLFPDVGISSLIHLSLTLIFYFLTCCMSLGYKVKNPDTKKCELG
jgi:hypothetical protein